MTITNADRPDPRAGKQASAAYAEHHAAYHRETSDTFSYMAGFMDLLMLDSLLKDYTLLDVGCGTGGYLRLIQNHRHVTGLDFATETIRVANALRTEFELRDMDFIQGLFEDHRASEPYDVVRLSGTFGCYQPWPVSSGAIDHAYALLKTGGIAVASHYSPPNALHALKAKLMPGKTLAITPKDFCKMWSRKGFKQIFSLKQPHSTIMFWQKET